MPALLLKANVDQKQPEDDPKFKFGIPSCAGCFPTVSDRGLVTACLHERAKPDFDTKRFLWTVWKRFRVWRNPRVVLMVAANSVLATPFEESLMGCSHEQVLLGDIGATNARFALLSNGVLGPIKYFTVAEFPRFPDVVNAFFDGDRRLSSVREAVLAVAGPVDEDRCVFTNCPWTIDARELCTAFDLAEVHLCNDFEATALSLPHLTAADLYRAGRRRGRRRSTNGSARPGFGARRRLPGAWLARPDRHRKRGRSRDHGRHLPPRRCDHRLSARAVRARVGGAGRFRGRVGKPVPRRRRGRWN